VVFRPFELGKARNSFHVGSAREQQGPGRGSGCSRGAHGRPGRPPAHRGGLARGASVGRSPGWLGRAPGGGGSPGVRAGSQAHGRAPFGSSGRSGKAWPPHQTPEREAQHSGP